MAIANTTLQIRKSGTPGVKPTSLANGELAINFADDKLYYKNSLGDISYFYGANNGPSFSAANANNTLLLASTPNDTLSIVPGENITISACTTTKTVTINGTGGDISPAYNQANAAFNQANSAFAEANIANDIAYTTALFANGAFREANSAAIFANGAFTQANNISSYANAQITIIAGVDATQNTNIASAQSFANGAFVTANSGALFANGAFLVANSAAIFANGAFDAANSAGLFANGAFDTANSGALFANGAFLVANSASSNTVVTQGVDATQNTNISSAQSFANGAFVVANSAADFANGAFSTANSASSNTVVTQGVDATQNTNIASAQAFANGAFDTANSAAIFANGAFTVANSASANTVTTQGVDATQNTNIALAQSFANSAFVGANNALPKTGGTMTGTLYIDTSTGLSLNTTGPIVVGGDVTINGNLNISGTANTYNSETLNVADPMIYLAANNTGDALDIGFVAHIVGTGSSNYSHYQHVGFVRDVTDRKWKLFSNVSNEPTTTIDFDANTIYDTLKVGSIEAETANINNLELYSYSTSAYAQANVAGSFANSAFTQGNNTVGVDATQNTNIASAQSFANGAFVVANNAASFANSAFSTANIAFDAANNAAIFANGAFVTANSGSLFANGAFETANSAAVFANGAFTTANNALANTGPLLTTNGSAQVLIANTTLSSSNTTGALVVSGGLGVTGNIYTSNVYTSNSVVITGISTQSGIPNDGNSTFSANAKLLIYTPANTFTPTAATSYYSIYNIPNANLVNQTGTTTFISTYNSPFISASNPTTPTSLVYGTYNLVRRNNPNDYANTNVNVYGTYNILVQQTNLPETAASASMTSMHNQLNILKGSVTAAYGTRVAASLGTSTLASSNVTNFYANYSAATLGASSGNTSTVTNYFGLYLDSVTLGATGVVTNRYGVYQPDGLAQNYFYGPTTVANTKTSTSTTTGALVVSGGLGVAGNVYATGLYDNGVEVLDFANSAFTKANTSVQLTATTQTITGNIIVSGSVTAALPPRVVSVADGTSVTMDADTSDIVTQTNTQAVGNLTINSPSGTPVNGQKIIFRLQSTNIQTFVWDSIFVGSNDLLLPGVSTGGSKYDYLGFVYNSTASKWHLLAKNFGF